MRLAHISWLPDFGGAIWRRLRAIVGPTPDRQELLDLQLELERQDEQLQAERSTLAQRIATVEIREDQVRAERKALSESRSRWDAMTRRLRLARRVNRTRIRQAETLMESAREEARRAQEQYAAWQAEMGEASAELEARQTELEQADERLRTQQDQYDAERSLWYEQLETQEGELVEEREKLEAKVREMAKFRVAMHERSEGELDALVSDVDIDTSDADEPTHVDVLSRLASEQRDPQTPFAVNRFFG